MGNLVSFSHCKSTETRDEAWAGIYPILVAHRQVGVGAGESLLTRRRSGRFAEFSVDEDLVIGGGQGAILAMSQQTECHQLGDIGMDVFVIAPQ